MSSAAPLRDEIATIAGPREWGDNRKSWLSRAARRSDVAFRTIKSIWYGETEDPRSSVEAKIRHAANKARQARHADAARLEAIASALESKDADFHCEDIARCRSLAGELRHMG